MATIIQHTTRAPGTILTAAIYNGDHQTHVTNADAINTQLGTLAATDFETGTWTPTLQGNTTAGTYTYAQRDGLYVKTNKLLYVGWKVTVDTVTTAGSGIAEISGLPFVPVAAASWIGAGQVNVLDAVAGVQANFGGFTQRLNSTFAIVQLQIFRTTGATANSDIATIFGAGTRWWGTMVYEVA